PNGDVVNDYRSGSRWNGPAPIGGTAEKALAWPSTQAAPRQPPSPRPSCSSTPGESSPTTTPDPLSGVARPRCPAPRALAHRSPGAGMGHRSTSSSPTATSPPTTYPDPAGEGPSAPAASRLTAPLLPTPLATAPPPADPMSCSSLPTERLPTTGTSTAGTVPIIFPASAR